MTYPRSQLVPPGSPGVYHCVSRCVRRAFLCGEDRYSGQSFEHRRQWIEDRMQHLADVFAVSLWAYAVMSNHLHVVVQVLPDVAAQWADEEVAERWIRLFPKAGQDTELRVEALIANPERLAVLRSRLSDLSWFMRCLSEHIARRANAEDQCKGRFWEGRFKCQALLDESAVLAAMAYVDLNPVRAALCDTLEDSAHTSAWRRLAQIDTNTHTGEVIAPVAGVGGQCVLGITENDYLQLLDWTGRQVHPNKRGTLSGPPPHALRRLHHDSAHWPRQVLAVGSDFHRAVGAAESLIAKASAMGQRWLHGIGAARRLLQASR
ncbi:MAG: transposase [Xanthomonadaceae bacterium]|nr:transposase [Xanthomonadaceae bacterium]